jgi:glycosyltransferase 2 family protein
MSDRSPTPGAAGLNPMTPSRLRKWAVAAVKLLVVVLVLWFIGGTIVQAVAKLWDRLLTIDPGWVLAAGILYLLGMFPAAYFWHRVLRALGQVAPIGQTMRAYFIGHLGKYVPGKAMVVVLRAAMVRGPGVDTSIAAVSVFVETLTMMAVGAIIATGILVVDPPADKKYVWYLLAAIGSAAVLVPPTLPGVFRRLVPRLGVGRSNPEIRQKLAGLKFRTLWTGWLVLTIGWLLMGLGLWAVSQALGGDQRIPVGQIDQCVAAVSLAYVVGFLSMVPAGAVTRDGALILLLSPYVGVEGAGEVAVLHRLISVVTEVLISVILYIGGRVAPPAMPANGSCHTLPQAEP